MMKTNLVRDRFSEKNVIERKTLLKSFFGFKPLCEKPRRSGVRNDFSLFFQKRGACFFAALKEPPAVNDEALHAV
jgi:hypothetical protein